MSINKLNQKPTKNSTTDYTSSMKKKNSNNGKITSPKKIKTSNSNQSPKTKTLKNALQSMKTLILIRSILPNNKKIQKTIKKKRPSMITSPHFLKKTKSSNSIKSKTRCTKTKTSENT